MKYFKLFLIAIFIVAFNSCSDDKSSNTNDVKIRVAALLDLSGHYSQFGVEEQQAMVLALLETKNVEVDFYDTQADIDLANKCLDTVINKGNYSAVVTLTSWISNGLSDRIRNNNMLQLAVGSAVYDYAQANNCIRLTGDVSQETEFLTNYLKKYKKIAVLYFNNDYGIGWYNALSTALSDKLIKAISYTDTDIDYTNQLNEIKSLDPDALVLISTREAVDIVKQASAIGLKVDMYGTRPTLTNQLLAEPSAEGLMFSYPDLDEDMPIFSSFKQKYGYRMSAFGAEGYDLIKTLDKYYQNNNKGNNVIFNNYKNMNYNGALGKIKFNNNCQAVYDYTICIIKNGTWQELK